MNAAHPSLDRRIANTGQEVALMPVRRVSITATIINLSNASDSDPNKRHSRRAAGCASLREIAGKTDKFMGGFTPHQNSLCGTEFAHPTTGTRRARCLIVRAV
jgi:hypothetical protein